MKNVLLFGSEEADQHHLPGWAAQLKHEIIACAEGLKGVYPRIWESAVKADREKQEESSKKKRKTEREYNSNVPGLFLSRLYYYFEDKVLRAMDVKGRECQFWRDDVTLMFDGMLVNPLEREIDLQILQQGIVEATGMAVTLTIKPTTPRMAIDVTDIPMPPVIVGHHYEAAEVMALLLDGKAVRSTGGTVFVCKDGVWTDRIDVVDDYLAFTIAKTNIMMQRTKADGEVVNVPFSSN